MKKYEPILRTEDYMKVYEFVLTISYDVEEFTRSSQPTDEELEKLKWIIAIKETLCDVPLRHAESAIRRKQLIYDEEQFLNDHFHQYQ